MIDLKGVEVSLDDLEIIVDALDSRRIYVNYQIEVMKDYLMGVAARSLHPAEIASYDEKISDLRVVYRKINSLHQKMEQAYQILKSEG